jgi:hypothetical protein
VLLAGSVRVAPLQFCRSDFESHRNADDFYDVGVHVTPFYLLKTVDSQVGPMIVGDESTD